MIILYEFSPVSMVTGVQAWQFEFDSQQWQW